MNHRKSRSLLINPPFQLSMIAWCIGVAIAVIGTFFLAFLIFFRNVRMQALAANLPSDHALFLYVDAQEAYFYRVFLFGSILALLLIVAGGLWISHRVAGPLHRLTAHLKRSSPAELEPVKFRRGDYFPELERAFNEFVSRRD